ncbi:MAG: hypothetical protein Q4C10_08330 [Clostridia bacterium]|nr:hypothetical protein [Clostridia bacterium]
MKLTISETPACAALCAAVTARLFLSLTLDSPTTHNGAWLSALLAGAAAVPLVLLLGCGKSHSAHQVSRITMIAFMMAAVLDASEAMRCVTRSAGFLALDDTRPLFLLLPVALAMLWCVGKNGDAIGFAASVWIRVFPLLLAVVVLMQARHLRLSWVFPLLGSGLGAIGAGAMRAAGGAAALCGALLFTEGDKEPRRTAGVLAIAAAVAALLIGFQLMMLPTRSAASLSWIDRLDGLITNGRAPLYLQLPMMVLWFAALFHLLAWDCFLSGALLQRCVPGLNGRLCVLIAVLTASLLTGVVESLGPLYDWRWTILLAAAALNLLPFRAKGGRACVDSR